MKIFLLNFTLAIIFLVTPINTGFAQEKKPVLTNEDISTKPSKPVVPNSTNDTNNTSAKSQSTKFFLSPFTADAIQTVESQTGKHQSTLKVALDGDKVLIVNELFTRIIHQDIGVIYRFRHQNGLWTEEDIVLANPNLTKKSPGYVELPEELGGIKQEFIEDTIIKEKTYKKYRIYSRERAARKSSKPNAPDSFLYVDEKTQLPYLYSFATEGFRLTIEYTNIKPGKPDISMLTPPPFIQNRVTVTQWPAGKKSPAGLFDLEESLEIKISPKGNLVAIANSAPGSVGVSWALAFNKTKLKEFFSMLESAKNDRQYRASTQDTTGAYYSLSGNRSGVVTLRLLTSSKDSDENCQFFRMDKAAIKWLNQTIPTLLQ